MEHQFWLEEGVRNNQTEILVGLRAAYREVTVGTMDLSENLCRKVELTAA